MSRHLAKGTEVARLRRRFSLVYSRHFHSVRFTISADRGWRLRAPDSSVRKARCLNTERGRSGNRNGGRGERRSAGWERGRERGRGGDGDGGGNP